MAVQRIMVGTGSEPAPIAEHHQNWLWLLALPAALAPFCLHTLVVTGHGLSLALGLLGAQLLLGAVLLRRRWPRWWWLIAAPAALTVAALAWATTPTDALLVVSGTSHATIFGGLLLLFGGSLRPGRTDLVTAMAQRLDPGWTPAMAGYTRAVTRAWTIFFGLQIVTSAALATLADAATWSFFVNLLDLPLVAVMFLAELTVRRRLYPDRPHVGLGRVIAAYRHSDPLGGAGADGLAPQRASLPDRSSAGRPSQPQARP